ncbi:hypothetical protein KFL_004800040 [Klebsormidium nitens]|uniref:Uncharacterized protein n=1 Tax=Klebsormidium nitens TaxID=105231 RepID=A0A1Y1IHP1_KLENI|nr:hypothetical protein KFL_004800040 [Klebsormidium nitens]|eukprot:GAQ89019.1 hypothetical protein KFL_004800040 [Klebsormidium nitens]
MEALQRNRACQKSMTAVLEAIQERIRANAMLQKKVRAVVKASKEVGAKPKEADMGVRTAGLDWPGRKKPKSRRTGCSRIFVALDGTGPEENPDIARTQPVRAVLAACAREQRWSEADKERLRGAVRLQVQEKWVTELMAALQREGREQGTGVSLSALHSGMAQMRQRPVTDDDITAALPTLDWENVMTKAKLVGKTAEDCQACWTADCAPGINRGPWTLDEDEQLKELVTKHEGHDWVSVAAELGTGRTAAACLMHYQRDLREERPEPSACESSGVVGTPVPDMESRPEPAQRRGPGRPPAQWRHKLGPVRKQLWTEEENLRLRYAVAAFGTTSWVHVAEVVGTRTDPQCRERWVNVLDPSVDQSPWTAEEDARLEALVRQLGAGKWAQLADEFNAGRPLKRTDDRLRKHYEALVTNKMIEPITTVPSPAAPPELQLTVADSNASRLIRRREAAQAREAKRKTAIVPREKITEISHSKRGRKPKQAKETAGIRKTGKSRLPPPLALSKAVPPPLEPGLSNVLRLVHAKKVQPTHVGRTGKPAAVVDGKSVHFMQRHVQPVIPVARPVTASQPPPVIAQANGHLGVGQIRGDQRTGARAKGAPRGPVAVRVSKPKLTLEERLAQRREKDRRRRAADRAEREAAEERNGTAAERVAARLGKEQERQEKRQRKEEERKRKEEARKRAREETRRRLQQERDEAQKKREAMKETLRREREEARAKRMREKEAEKEAKQRKKAEEDAATGAEGTGRKAAAHGGREETQVGRAKVQRPVSKKVRKDEGVGTATGKGAQKKGGRGARVGVRVGPAKKGAVQADGKAQRGATRGKKDAKKKAAVGRGARKGGDQRAEKRADGEAAEQARGSRAQGASPGGRSSQRLRAVGRPVTERSGNSGADDLERNATEGKRKKAGRKRAAEPEGSQGRPAKRGKVEEGTGTEEGTEVVRVTRSRQELVTSTRKRRREEGDEQQRGGTREGAEKGPGERRGKKGRVEGAKGNNETIVQAGEKKDGRKVKGKLDKNKEPGRMTRSTHMQDAARVTRSGERGTRRSERERGEGKKRDGGVGEVGPGKRDENGKKSVSPTRSLRRVSRDGGSAGEETGVDVREEKESKPRQRTSRLGSADIDEVSGTEGSECSEESEIDGRVCAPARSPEKRTRAKKTAADAEPGNDVTSPDGKLPGGRETRGRKGRAEAAVWGVPKVREREGELEAAGKRVPEQERSLRAGDKREGGGVPSGKKKRKRPPTQEGRAATLPSKDPRTGTRGAEKVRGKQAPPREAKSDQLVQDRSSTRKTRLTDTEPRRSLRNSKRNT